MHRKGRAYIHKYFGRHGTPDYFLFLKGGKTVHMHIPKRYERLSNAQKAYKIKIEALGHIYAEARSIEDVGSIINRYTN